MIVLKGQGTTSGELPISLEGARHYFLDTPAFLAKIAAVDVVKPLSRPGAYLVIHHAQGGLSYQVRMVAALQTEWHEGGMTLRPLDFELSQVRAVDHHPMVKGMVEGDLRLSAPQPDRTVAAFGFTVSIELPLPPVLAVLPRPVVQGTGDAIMSLQTGMVVASLFRKVMDDFKLNLAAPTA